MALHTESIVYTLRWYEGAKSYEEHDPYDAVATVMMLDGRAFLCALHGLMTKDFWVEIKKWMLAQGVTEVEVIRHGKRRVYSVNKPSF